MSSYDNDPPERIGSDPRGPLADPPKSRKAAAPAPVAAPKPVAALAEEMASPTPAVELVSKPGSHLKFAVVRPAKNTRLRSKKSLMLRRS